MTTIIPASSDSQNQSPSNKTVFKARKKLFQDDLFQVSPVKRAKPEYEVDFPVPTLSPASSPNKRIANIAFPVSPGKDPDLMPYRSPVPTLPKAKRNLFDSIPAFSEKQELGISLPSLPHSSFPIEIQTTKKQTPPPAPSKKQRTGDPVSVFKKQHDALCNGTFKYDVTYLAKGSYSNVYTLETTPVQVIPEVDNSTLVLKAFHGEKSGFIERPLRGYLHNAIENYRAVIAAGLPVARIYNVDTAEQEGYIIQQKVPGKIDPMNAQQMLQVRRFFDISVGQGLFMDLTPENFALENGQVVLIDFVEGPDDDMDLMPQNFALSYGKVVLSDIFKDPDDEIDLFHKKAIETWLKSYQQAGGEQAQATVFLNGLSANHYQKYVQQLLSRYTH